MKALLCHNHYRIRGGEDQVFMDEARLLETNGCEVVRYIRCSDEIEKMSMLDTARKTLWNQDSYRDLRELIQQQQPDIMHCTNTFPLISPAAYAAARDERIPIVQSLHNFRTVCSNALLLRDSKVCEACLTKSVPLAGIIHRCYRNSYAASTVMAALIAMQRRRRASNDPVTQYIALSEFSKQKYLAAGFAEDRIAVKPNFVSPDPGSGSGAGGYALFVGRLSEEKGLDVMLDAWSRLKEPIPLKIVGDGPLVSLVERAQRNDARIEWLGRRSVEEVYDLVGDAVCLVVPSVWYEICPKTILEAFSRGTPVVASKLGAMEEFIKHGETGWHFESGNADELATRLQEIFADRNLATSLRPIVRREFEAKYTAEVNFGRLMDIYAAALEKRPETLVSADCVSQIE
ncbi:MAG: glycosyltransferase [Planctomycetales bacterium]|nr:glycosyltransferase [Planctomycetales bacterium]